MTPRALYDADSHIMELPDFLTAYADPSIRDQLPPILPVGRLDSSLVGLPTGGSRGHSAEKVAELKTLGDRILRGPKWYEALGAFNCRGARRGARYARAAAPGDFFVIRVGRGVRMQGSRRPLWRRARIQSRDEGIRRR